MLKDLKIFLALLSDHKKSVILAMALGSVGGLVTGGGLTTGVERLFTLIFSDDRSLSVSQVIVVASSFPILFLVLGICVFSSAYLLNYAGLAAIRDLRAKVFDRIQRLPLAYFQSSKTGDLISRITADTAVLQVTLTFIARNVITQPATIVGAIGYLYWVAAQNEGVYKIYICLIALPIVIFPIRKFTHKIEYKARQQQQELGSLTNNLAQNLTAAREIRAFNLQKRENTRFAARLADLFIFQMKVVKYQFGLGPVVEVCSSVGLSIAFIIGYYNGVPAGVFTSIFLALYLTYTAVKKLGTFASELSKGVASYQRIAEILDSPVDIDDPVDPIEITSVDGDIEFKDVSFSYGETPALKSANARIQKGDICALVGPSGAGKSTFANLVPRFYDVTSGGIFLDGHDVRRFRLTDLRDQIAIVSQEPVLFDDTILENIRLGRQDATDAEVREAARQAFAHEFISDEANCPDGYETLVGERGARLSGGQKQRIAIARAFLRNAPILILDEATSALDSESEAKVQLALDKLVSGKTVLIIAHRFSTIKNANKILVFNDGAITASGSHEELYQTSPLYKALYDQQQNS
ncbi:ABC transporter ATP-binding protein [Pelagicoccus sp. SDUM812002]|uniref:ABC transporter ATP-binding protein n=1 Tax=Pelagicoccus sp. SDUM812002 TaxID=3041266 RepID=UPI00280E2C5D|nr:ABC transporter ATP-binding protein [Pelagicoccus sp. SDUM812002]MDQ8187978.1 ABC transporter ATP-binding protein [Pelagicoccus sp. SDUM812002]